jgi:hypothetical protein
MQCNRCDTYKKEAEKYKRKYEIAKSGLTKEERDALVELICNEQLKHLVINKLYNTDKYNLLEELKVKIKII